MFSFYEFNSGQKKGIIGLLAINVLLFSLIIFWRASSNSDEITDKDEIYSPSVLTDSLKSMARESKSQTIYPFNPNFLTDYRGYVLGLSIEEMDRLFDYREQGKWINSTEDFQRVTQISDSLLNLLAPYFQFPEWVISAQNRPSSAVKNESSDTELSYAEKGDLNRVEKEDLQKINGIEEVLARRITNYREQLGGFVDDLQLNDVYGLTYEKRMRISNRYTVKTKPLVEKKDINTMGIAELVEIHYIDYELARKIVEYRTLHERIDSFDELIKIESFPGHKLEQIKLYLKIEEVEK